MSMEIIDNDEYGAPIWGEVPDVPCLAATVKGARCKQEPVYGALCGLHYSIAEKDITRLTLIAA